MEILLDEDKIVNDVVLDFQTRQSQKRYLEAQWQLNTNFWLGNQYNFIDGAGNIVEEDDTYYWQNKLVFNHIAQILEMRLTKLNKIRPKISVRPASGDSNDVRASKVSTKVLNSVCDKLDISSKINMSTLWSELTGTSFYKITWNSRAGKLLGVNDNNKIYEGEVQIDVCSPYEIYPDNLTCCDIDDCKSIIHARALHVDEIETLWGKRVDPENVDLILIDGSCQKKKQVEKSEYAVVIERYTRPNAKIPNGELVIVASNKLLYYGDLPYINGYDGTRIVPFVKQDSVINAGAFFGSSTIERVIPIQRAFNAVKNRKHEFLNRISMGILAVEDGSIDTDDLMEEGLPPGKILAYKIGSAPPQLLNNGGIPSDFSLEEEKLLKEFSNISGVSDLMRNSTLPNVSSGTAIQLLVDQDDTRLSLTADNIRKSIRKIGQHILRLYKQFAVAPRLSRVMGDEGNIEIMDWNNSDLSSDDVILDTINELTMSPANQQNMLFQLLKNGLLYNSDGKLSDSMRYKILDALGYGGLEQTTDLVALHIKKAEMENYEAKNKQIEIEDIDNHELHIDVHTKFILGECTNNQLLKEKIIDHIKEHKKAISILKENMNNLSMNKE